MWNNTTTTSTNPEEYIKDSIIPQEHQTKVSYNEIIGSSVNDFEKKFFQFLNEDKKIIFKKKINAKKNIRQYTLFYHYRILSRYLKI